MSTPPSNPALQHAHGTQITGNVSICLLLIKLEKVVNDSVVKITTSEVCITINCKDFKYTIVDSEKKDIKGTTSMTTKIIDDSDYLEFTTFLVQIVSDGSGSRLINKLIDNTEIENGTGILGHLTLSIIQVQQLEVQTFSLRYTSSLLHLCQNNGANLLGYLHRES
ncbi:NAD-specific glutamate dehydrogenase-domain-containing protein [Boletus coccyginus]|nr:NAD-specific glutamate dehydrogenase-domain-containing protein [Boletus coccyginus]